MYDKNSGRSRGFGFVEFVRVDEARSAKNSMDGKVRDWIVVVILFGLYVF